MFSSRTPGSFAPNAWTERRLQRDLGGHDPAHDLMQTDPTVAGLSPLPEAATALALVGPAAYAPEPLGLPTARAAVAAMFAEDGTPIESGVIALTPSTSESYAHLFRLFCNPGEGVAIPLPGYPLFEPIARAEGVETRGYRVLWDGVWHLDRDSCARALEGARVFVTVEPGNPTGAVLDPKDRQWLERECTRRGVAIVADEVFRTPSSPGTSWLAGRRRALTIVLGGLSKTCGLPHLKLAWAARALPRGDRALRVARGPVPRRRDAGATRAAAPARVARPVLGEQVAARIGERGAAPRVRRGPSRGERRRAGGRMDAAPAHARFTDERGLGDVRARARRRDLLRRQLRLRRGFAPRGEPHRRARHPGARPARLGRAIEAQPA